VSFADPLWLVALLAVPLALLAYLHNRSRAKRYAVRFTGVQTLRVAAMGSSSWWRHVPAALLLAALAALTLALARPHQTIRVPIQSASIVLVTDHSGSMQAGDVAPTRLLAAEQAANAFIDQLPSAARVGVVTFSNTPDTVQAPSADHGVARQAIDSQSALGATDTGDALAVALALVHQGMKPAPSAIVLLSDGAWNTGQNPVVVATQAGRDRVPIYTVALGTDAAVVPNPDPYGPPLSAPPDPRSLAQISHASGGRAFTAQDGGQLNSIYQRLGAQLSSTERRHDITATFAIVGLLALVGAVVVSLRTVARLP